MPYIGRILLALLGLVSGITLIVQINGCQWINIEGDGNNILQGDSSHIHQSETLDEHVQNSLDAIRLAVKGSGQTLKCKHYRLANDLIVECRGLAEFYKLGVYAIEESPRAESLAEALVDVYDNLSFALTRSNFDLSLALKATSDGHPMDTPVEYTARTIRDCPMYDDQGNSRGTITLRHGSKSVDNESLGCARVGAFLGYLVDNGVTLDLITVEGAELEDRGGEYRYIRTVAEFQGLFHYLSSDMIDLLSSPQAIK